jgi:hypothetical protein
MGHARQPAACMFSFGLSYKLKDLVAKLPVCTENLIRID